MAKNKKYKNFKKLNFKGRKIIRFNLPEETKRSIWAVFLFLVAAIITLSFFDKAGAVGRALIKATPFLIGKATFALPLLFILGALSLFSSKYKGKWPMILAIFFLILGIAGILSLNFSDALTQKPDGGGWLGYLLSKPLLSAFGFWVTQIIFIALIIIGILIFWQLLKPLLSKKEIKFEKEAEFKEEKKSLITRIFKMAKPEFKVKEIPPSLTEREVIAERQPVELKTKSITEISKLEPNLLPYQSPPVDLLESDRQVPNSGDIRQNSTIIKKTLQNFGIQVEMSEINIGPTVTQYNLKPAEGIKLSKITALSNDLSLALASHPIRIEAPIPGKSLIGIEVPNKVRAQIRLRDLISNQNFQNSRSNLALVLGRDVSGFPVYADLSRMPHLLVAGSTGTGKTIFLNSLILSFLYKNSPEILRLILVDPKRVEFPVYNELPHLLCPVIFDPQKTINSLKWLISEMERRFEVLAETKARDISSFNEIAIAREEPILPYIVLIIDELADLMAARGKEMEAGIVRLAQMARAVGIHLVLATQRPSVDIITGLIKANITSRVTFQVASQVDSRTVLDMAGAERLLGQGDLLFVSAEIVKPRRIQGAYVSEKEVRKVVNWIKSKVKSQKPEEGIFENELAVDLEKTLESPETETDYFYGGEDPLYEEAKKVVIEFKKASASLLQRRLRIGYARAARLIDMLEERGVVGPGEGAKPREVYFNTEENPPAGGEGWKKI